MSVFNYLFGGFVSEKYLCLFARDYLNVYLEDCQMYDVFYPESLETIQELLSSCQVCEIPFFVLCFMLALLFSMFGMFYSLNQLYRSYKKNVMKHWRAYAPYMVGRKTIRAVCLIGGLMEASCWVLLTLGLLTATTPFMKPWLYIKGLILIGDFIFLLLEASFDENHATFHAFGNFAISIVGHVLVLNTYNGLQQAINAGNVGNMRLVSSLQPILNKYVSFL